MSLFGNKRNEKQTCCCHTNTTENLKKSKRENASVKILGSGCAKCNALETAVKEALKQLGMDTNIEHVTDFSQIAAYGVMSTPALVVDGNVVSFGKVLKIEEAKEILLKVCG